MSSRARAFEGDDAGPEHEQAMVKAFIVTRKQQRWLDFLANPKRRKDILRTLPHLKDLDERFLLRVPAPQSTSVILEMLQSRGAPEQCYVVSQSAGLDDSPRGIGSRTTIFVNARPTS